MSKPSSAMENATPATENADTTMSALTYAEVAQRKNKRRMVYNLTQFVDEHPGGEEALLGVAGQDATEPFEDVGHSDEAREILAELLVDELRRLPTDPRPKITVATGSAAARQLKSESPPPSSSSSSFGLLMYALVAAAAAACYALLLK
ncbi:hypothetical protein KEM52_002438 [Ascosphaera acerosa]|nr:hypothetical protein KEM52_002438 [Ascosphaera acerosa]